MDLIAVIVTLPNQTRHLDAVWWSSNTSSLPFILHLPWASTQSGTMGTLFLVTNEVVDITEEETEAQKD